MKKLFYLFIPLSLFSCGGGEESSEETNDSTSVEAIHETRPSFEDVDFESSDGLTVYGNLYDSGLEGAKSIVLCHQARFNKFEYAGIGERLNEMGFNCLAIDQRSGGPIGDMPNETNLAAKEKEMGVGYEDAIPDIKAAVDWMADKYDQPVILWGSSYSSTLVLYEATNDNVSALVSFSPGNYFADTLGSLLPILENCDKPLFLTSGNWPGELDQTTELASVTDSSLNQVQFIPEGSGHHGSRALWPEQDGGEEYWNAITEWLEKL